MEKYRYKTVYRPRPNFVPLDTGPAIELWGVPQISDAAYHEIALTGELPYLLEVETNQRIREACAEIQRRKSAAKFRDFQPVLENEEE